MKKLFISVPMRQRSWENIYKSIDKLKAIAEKEIHDVVDVISSYVREQPDLDTKPELKSLWYLGESLKLLSKADIFIGVLDSSNYGFYGCDIEAEAAQRYGIPTILVPIETICDDLL